MNLDTVDVPNIVASFCQATIVAYCSIYCTSKYYFALVATIKLLKLSAFKDRFNRS